MDLDDRLNLTFMVLYGATTYVGKSNDLDPYSDADIDLIRRSSNDRSYTKESMQILVDACDYFERTPRKDMSISYLIGTLFTRP